MKKTIMTLVVALITVSLVFANGGKETTADNELPTLKVLGPFLANFDPATDPSRPDANKDPV